MIDRTGEIRSTRAPMLRTDQIEILKRYGHTRKTEVGDVLFRAGDTRNDFIVILEGVAKVGDDFAGEELRTIGVFHEGRFLGELNMLTGQAMYLTGVVSEAGRSCPYPASGSRRSSPRSPTSRTSSSRPSWPGARTW